jgi:hypothetical protein
LDDKALEDKFAIAAPQGILPTLLESWCEQKAVLQAYINLLDAALTRSFVVLDRLGYTPENPPPGGGPGPNPSDGEPHPDAVEQAWREAT